MLKKFLNDSGNFFFLYINANSIFRRISQRKNVIDSITKCGCHLAKHRIFTYVENILKYADNAS